MSDQGTTPPADADRQRWEELVGDLLAEAESAPEATTRFECLREAALMYESQLGDPRRALLTWQAALAEHPESDQAAVSIERLAEALGSWHTVLPECEALLGATDDAPARAALLTWMARWLERHVGDESAAERRLLEAVALCPGSLAAAEGLSALYAARGDWARAAEALERAGQAGDGDEAVGALLEAARLFQSRARDQARASALYRRVLELSPQNTVAAEGLAEAAGQGLDPAAMCEQYRRQLETDPDNLGVVRQWAEVAFAHGRWDDVRLLFERLFERAGGVAGAGKPDRRARLNDALDRFVAARRWPEAVDVLRTLAADAGPELRAKYHLAAGKIAQNELGNDALAVEQFNLALDADPVDAKTFDRLFAILSGKRAWHDAERDVRRQLQRLRAAGRADNVTMLALWKRLGDVYRLGLRDLPRAAEAYAECARLAPDDRRYTKLVAELGGRVAGGAAP